MFKNPNLIEKNRLRLIIIAMCCQLFMPTESYSQSIPTSSSEKITILDQDLQLKDKQSGRDGSFISEYIPSNSTWDDWRLMFAVQFIPGEKLSPVLLAQQKVIEVKSIKSSQLNNGEAWMNKNNNSAIADFIIQSQDFNFDAHTGCIEHNFWCFVKYQNGVLAYQIARRVYAANTSNDIGVFKKSLIFGIIEF